MDNPNTPTPCDKCKHNTGEYPQACDTCYITADDTYHNYEGVGQVVADTKAKAVCNQINSHYTYKGRTYINTADITGHMKRGMIDHDEKALHHFSGFSESIDGTLCIFFYEDGSVLVMGCCHGLSAT